MKMKSNQLIVMSVIILSGFTLINLKYSVRDSGAVLSGLFQLKNSIAENYDCSLNGWSSTSS